MPNFIESSTIKGLQLKIYRVQSYIELYSI